MINLLADFTHTEGRNIMVKHVHSLINKNIEKFMLDKSVELVERIYYIDLTLKKQPVIFTPYVTFHASIFI